MNRIDELKQQIATIESQVTPGMSKEDMYDLLVVAYNHLKDIIALTQGNIPLKDDRALEVPLRDAEDALANAVAENGRLKDTISTRDDEIFKLNAWKDGANLEGEVLRKEAKTLKGKLSQIANLAN